MVKYWFRLISMPGDRLAAHCYWSLFNSNSKNDPWLNAVVNIINSTGQYYIWAEQKSIATESKHYSRKLELYVCQTLKDLSFQASTDKVSMETKLSLLNNSKNVNEPARYLNSIPSRKYRSLLCKLRLGTLDLEIEKGRRHNIPRSERACKLCVSGETEDAIHFILKFEMP